MLVFDEGVQRVMHWVIRCLGCQVEVLLRHLCCAFSQSENVKQLNCVAKVSAVVRDFSARFMLAFGQRLMSGTVDL